MDNFERVSMLSSPHNLSLMANIASSSFNFIGCFWLHLLISHPIKTKRAVSSMATTAVYVIKWYMGETQLQLQVL